MGQEGDKMADRISKDGTIKVCICIVFLTIMSLIGISVPKNVELYEILCVALVIFCFGCGFACLFIFETVMR